MTDVTVTPALPDSVWRELFHVLPLDERSAKVFARSSHNARPSEERLSRDAVLAYRDQRLPSAEHHAVAALCLYGQQFGFTQEDVRRLRQLADVGSRYVQDPGYLARTDEGEFWHGLAERIAALLPSAD